MSASSPLPLLRGPAPAPYFHPFFKFFRFSPPLSGEGDQNLLPPPLKKGGGGPNYELFKNFEFNNLSKGLYAHKTRNYKCLHITLRYTNPDFKISLYVRVHIKRTFWNFAFYILRILKLFPVKFVKFLKIRPIFNIFYCFSMFANNFSHISRVHISKTKSVLMWNLRLIIFIRRQRY